VDNLQPEPGDLDRIVANPIPDDEPGAGNPRLEKLTVIDENTEAGRGRKGMAQEGHDARV